MNNAIKLAGVAGLGKAAAERRSTIAIEGPRAGVRRWWLFIPATLLVGLCFGLPLFLLPRERALSHS
jgi:hypothetical protein